MRLTPGAARFPEYSMAVGRHSLPTYRVEAGPGLQQPTPAADRGAVPAPASRVSPRSLFRSVLPVALAAGCLLLAAAASAFTYVVVVFDPRGATPPRSPRNTPGMKMRLGVAKAKGGDTIRLTARRFRGGEYVSVWDFHRSSRKVRALQGRPASPSGRLGYSIATFAGITPHGRHTICAKGERSGRVACDSYRLSNPRLKSGDGYKPPGSGGGSSPGSGGDSGGDSGGGDGYQAPTTGPGYESPATGPGYQPPGSA